MGIWRSKPWQPPSPPPPRPPPPPWPPQWLKDKWKKQKERRDAIAAEKKRKEDERLRLIKEEEERVRQIEEKKKLAIRNAPENVSWNKNGKNEKRTYECNDINGNRLGGKNLYIDNDGIVNANEKPIALDIDQMKLLHKQQPELTKSISNPNWIKSSSDNQSKNFAYPYDPYNESGDKIEYGGKSLITSNGIFKLEMTEDGNLVLKKSIKGCNGKYTKRENIGDYKLYKTDATGLLDKVVFANGSTRKINPVGESLLERDNSHAHIGSYIPENLEDGRKPVQNLDECKSTCTSTKCDYMYYIEESNGTFACYVNNGKVSKYIPIQPNSNIKKSDLYIANKKMKPIPKDDLTTKDLNTVIHKVKNYKAYSDLDYDPALITDAKDLGGNSIKQLQIDQEINYNGTTESFNNHGFQATNEIKYVKKDGIRKGIQDHQLTPMKKIAQDYTELQGKIGKTYDELGNDIHAITNTEKTGVRDKLETEKEYIKHFVEVNLNPSKTVSDVRLDDINTIISYNNSVFNLGVVTASTLLVAGIMIAKE